METYSLLTEDQIEQVQDLIKLNIDSARGYGEAADSVDHDGIANLLRRLGSERSANAKSLQRLVRFNDEEPEDDGSAAGTLHRYWLELRAAISSGDPESVLREVERGNDSLRDAYKDALAALTGTPAETTVRDQYRQMASGDEAVKRLRKAEEAA